MNYKTLLLIIGAILLGIGLLKPDFSNIIKPLPNNPNIIVDDLNLSKPSDELMPAVKNVIKALSGNDDRKIDGKRLASLYNDISTLIALDGNDQVIKNTDEIRQVNKLAGLMLKLNIKDKYEDLSEAAQLLIIQAIGDDHVLLDSKLRSKAVEGFQALAWACNEGSK